MKKGKSKATCTCQSFLLHGLRLVEVSKSQFNYCPLAWMFHSKKLNNCKRVVQFYRALMCTYNENHSTFREFLRKVNSMTFHHRNLYSLAIEIYKIQNDVLPQIMKEIFELK